MNLPKEEILIRRMSAADIPRVVECAAAIAHAPRYFRSTWEAMLDTDAVPLRLALVATNNAGGVHGFAVVSIVPPQAELESIAVAKISQRQGIGSRLLKEILQEIRWAGVQQLGLEVRESNQPAIALYRRAGFRETGRRRRYYTDPIEDALLMDISLM